MLLKIVLMFSFLFNFGQQSTYNGQQLRWLILFFAVIYFELWLLNFFYTMSKSIVSVIVQRQGSKKLQLASSELKSLFDIVL